MTIEPDRLVHVIDDSEAVCASLEAVLPTFGLQVQTHPSAEAFLSHRDSLRRGCLVIDSLMPGLNGVALLRRLRSDGCDWPAVLLTADFSVDTAVRATTAGASAVLHKPCDPSSLADVVHGTVRKEHAGTPLPMLSPREREIVGYLSRGATSKEIGRTLGISPRTVEAHRARILVKTGARNAADLAHMFAALATGSDEPVRMREHS